MQTLTITATDDIIFKLKTLIDNFTQNHVDSIIDIKIEEVKTPNKQTQQILNEIKQDENLHSFESADKLAEWINFDENRQLTVAELIQSVGVHTNKKATIEEMNKFLV
ncbi:MAG: hypothetical protein KGV51_06945 [Moraxellaceae bacterium]|nr:hypothetical protein [Moraxellaceae bacterium]